MIAISLVFGPCHGKTFIWHDKLPDPMVVMEDNVPTFQEYEFGVPKGAVRASMMTPRHYYGLHEVFDQGTEECAVYFHAESCCNKDYGSSEKFKQYMDGQKKEQSRQEAQLTKESLEDIGFHSDGWESVGSIQPPSEAINELVDEVNAKIAARKQSFGDSVIRTRMSNKSAEYIHAVEAMNKLINSEKDKKK